MQRRAGFESDIQDRVKGIVEHKLQSSMGGHEARVVDVSLRKHFVRVTLRGVDNVELKELYQIYPDAKIFTKPYDNEATIEMFLHVRKTKDLIIIAFIVLMTTLFLVRIFVIWPHFFQ